VADALRNESDVTVEVVDGARGEFSVAVDGQEVARKEGAMPPVHEVAAAVRRAGKASGARA
jgi:hypothetical protein